MRLAPGQGWVLLPDFRKMLGVRPTIFLSGSPLINYIYKPINKYIYIYIYIYIYALHCLKLVWSMPLVFRVAIHCYTGCMKVMKLILGAKTLQLTRSCRLPPTGMTQSCREAQGPIGSPPFAWSSAPTTLVNIQKDVECPIIFLRNHCFPHLCYIVYAQDP